MIKIHYNQTKTFPPDFVQKLFPFVEVFTTVEAEDYFKNKKLKVILTDRALVVDFLFDDTGEYDIVGLVSERTINKYSPQSFFDHVVSESQL